MPDGNTALDVTGQPGDRRGPPRQVARPGHAFPADLAGGLCARVQVRPLDQLNVAVSISHAFGMLEKSQRHSACCADANMSCQVCIVLCGALVTRRFSLHRLLPSKLSVAAIHKVEKSAPAQASIHARLVTTKATAAVERTDPAGVIKNFHSCCWGVSRHVSSAPLLN